jgi:hypothetical protein
LITTPSRARSHTSTKLTLPTEGELVPALEDFHELFARTAQQAQFALLQALGLNVDSDIERSLGRRMVETLPDA